MAAPERYLGRTTGGGGGGLLNMVGIAAKCRNLTVNRQGLGQVHASAAVIFALSFQTSICAPPLQSELRLLCKEGGCMPLANYGSCNLGRAAAHAFMARPGFSQGPAGAAAIAALTKAGGSAAFLADGTVWGKAENVCQHQI